MRIAIFINTSWNIFNFRVGLIRHFLNEGHSVVAIAPADAYSSKLEEMGCTFHALEVAGSGLNPVHDLNLMVQLHAILKKDRPDIVLSYTIKPNIYGSLVCGWMGIPIICNVSGLGTVFLWKGLLRRFGILLYRLSFRFSSWVFFQNDQDMADFLEMVKINPAKCSLLPGSGIDLTRFQPKQMPITNESPIFLMVGRLIVEKGVQEFADAAQLVHQSGRKATFWLAGALDEGHARSIDKAALENWISTNTIYYFAHTDDIISVMERADAIVLPSYREGTPRTLLEGGALAKPLITTDVPGCRHVVRDGVNGFLAEVRNPRSLADKMLLFLSLSPDERAQLGRNARKWIEEYYDEQRVMDLYAVKIQQLVEKRN